MGVAEQIPLIISACGAVVSAYFAYNQYTKNAETDVKISQWKAEEERKSARRSDNISQIYGVLWQLLHDMQADRVYIVQPHPLAHSMYLSISLEVKRNGISAMKPNIQNLPMADVAVFSSELSSRDFLFYRRVESEVKDKRARAIMMMNGCISTVIKRLQDEEHDWIGSVFCGFTHEQELHPTEIRQQMQESADNIQYILPEYR